MSYRSLTLGGLLVRALLVLIVAAIAAVVAFALSERQPKRYQAQTQLAYGIALRPELQVLGTGFIDATDDDVRLATEVQVLNSFDIARRTVRAAPDLGLTAKEVDDRVQAAPVGDTQVASITAKDSSPARAARLAAVYREQYLTDRRVRDRRRAREVSDALSERLRSLPRSQRIGATGAQLRTQLGALTVLERSGSGVPQLVQGVRASSTAVSPQTSRNVLFGALFGLAVGIGLVALRPPARRSPPSPEGDGDDAGAYRDRERVPVDA
jgi:capsular polysaccharide biosynthesis protein